MFDVFVFTLRFHRSFSSFVFIVCFVSSSSSKNGRIGGKLQDRFVFDVFVFIFRLHCSFSSCVLFLRLHRRTEALEVNCKIDLRSDLHAPNMFGSTCTACDEDKSSRQANSEVPSFLTCRILYSHS